MALKFRPRGSEPTPGDLTDDAPTGRGGAGKASAHDDERRRRRT